MGHMKATGALILTYTRPGKSDGIRHGKLVKLGGGGLGMNSCILLLVFLDYRGIGYRK